MIEHFTYKKGGFVDIDMLKMETPIYPEKTQFVVNFSKKKIKIRLTFVSLFLIFGLFFIIQNIPGYIPLIFWSLIIIGFLKYEITLLLASDEYLMLTRNGLFIYNSFFKWEDIQELTFRKDSVVEGADYLKINLRDGLTEEFLFPRESINCSVEKIAYYIQAFKKKQLN